MIVPAKIQAYIASSKIILGMLNGEGRDIINQSKSGFCIPSGDIDVFLDIINAIKILDTKERKTIEANAKQYYIENFNKEKLFAELEAVFNS